MMAHFQNTVQSAAHDKTKYNTEMGVPGVAPERVKKFVIFTGWNMDSSTVKNRKKQEKAQTRKCPHSHTYAGEMMYEDASPMKPRIIPHQST